MYAKYTHTDAYTYTRTHTNIYKSLVVGICKTRW